MKSFDAAFHTSHFGPTRGGMGCADYEVSRAVANSVNQPVVKSVMSVAVVHLKTGDIAVTTFMDGTFLVEAVPVTVTNSTI